GAFFLLDIVVYPEHAFLFGTLRLTTAGFAVLLVVASRAGASDALVRRLSLVGMSYGVGVIAFMCAINEGFSSPYALGVVLTLVCCVTLGILNPPETIVLVFGTVGFYIALNLAWHPEAPFKEVLAGIMYMLMTAFFSVINGGLMEWQRRRLFKSEHEVRSQRDALRTAYDYQVQFTRTVSHELRTPLSSIIGITGLITRQEDALSPKTEDRLGLIERSAKRLLRVVNDILDHAKIEAGTLTLSYSQLEVEPLLRELSEETSSLLGSRPVRVEIECDPTLTFESDGDRVRQILMNLAGNAAKFTYEGRIAISAVATDGGVRFDVEDSGVGIPEAEQEKIFEAFHQSSEISRSGGTGLGLSIVKRLLALLGGRIELESAEGEGTRFRVWIPSAPSATSKREEPNS
ncbi:MAG: HAMP domain-containing sensor histidine kinase, partial [Myxococcota bacterium]